MAGGRGGRSPPAKILACLGKARPWCPGHGSIVNPSGGITDINVVLPHSGRSNDFVVKVIRSTGNYGEIYERNLGKNSNVTIQRGLNELYKNGGLLISPPFN